MVIYIYIYIKPIKAIPLVPIKAIPLVLTFDLDVTPKSSCGTHYNSRQ